MFSALAAQLRKRKTNGRGHPTHFTYRIQLLEIKPWLPPKQPSQLPCAKSYILRWHRGHHRSGTAQSYTAYLAPGNGQIPFNHAFELPVTLYCSSSSSAFEEKTITFSLLDADYSAGPPLAHGGLNLALYGSLGSTHDEPITTTVWVPLILGVHVSSIAGIPNLHLLIRASPSCKRDCFGDGKCQAKALSLASYLQLQSVRLLGKEEAAPPLVDGHSHEALVAALLEEGDEHQEEEEAEIEAFTDDESLSGLHTPSEGNSPQSHNEENSTIVEDNDLPQANSRVPVVQVTWTPTPKGHYTDEVSCPSKTASEFYNSNKHRRDKPLGNSALFCNSPSLPNTSKQTAADNRKVPGSSDERTPQVNGSSLLHCPVEAGEGPPTKLGTGKPAHVKHVSERSSDKTGGCNDAGGSLQHRISEAEALRLRIINQLHESKVCGLKFDGLDSELREDDDILSVEVDTNVLEEARRKFAEGAEKRDAKITKRLLEETKVKLAEAEAKSLAASEKIMFLQLCISRLEGELQDVALNEMLIFCTVAEHGEPPHSVLTCACYLGKLHKLAFTNWTHQRRASLVKSTISGLILATRACGQDVARLTFWWSNVLALRHACSLPLNAIPVPACSNVVGGPAHLGSDAGKDSELSNPAKPSSPTGLPIEGSEACDWGESNKFCTALEKVEAWIYGKVVDSIWRQVFAPLIQDPAYPPLQEEFSHGNDDKDDIVCKEDNETLSVFDFEDETQQNTSIDIWKKTYLDALQKLCPVRVGGKACGCISALPRLVIEECVGRLDVLMFNAILPSSDMGSSSHHLSHAVFGAQVLPITPKHLTFGAGVQLKNVVSTWSTWLTIYLEKLSNTASNAVPMDESRRFISFPMLKALADLLMLPRDMVTDKCVRKEVCPVFTLPVVRRIIASVEPDIYAPDAVSPSLLAALNAEIDIEKRMYGDAVQHNFSANGLALEPRVAYCSQTRTFKDMMGSTLDTIVSEWGMQDDGIKNGLHDLETTLTGSLKSCREAMSGLSAADQGQDLQKQMDNLMPIHRYKLLEELWA